MKVAGLGQCSLDYIASLERYPVEDTKLEANGLTIQGGGPVAMALVSLSRLGVKTFFMGRVSDDGAGTEILRGLKAEGVDVSGVKVGKGGESQRAFIIVNEKTGSRTILWKRPTVAPLSARDLDPAVVCRADMLLVDGLMVRASLKAVRAARHSGVPVMLDAGRVREGMLELAALSDYVVASEEFAVQFAGTPRAALKRLSALGAGGAGGAGVATITLGSKGSLTLFEGKLFKQPAFKVRAVDTTGAGDVFHGGYIYGLLKGWDIKKTVRFASAFAALKCLTSGGRTGIPTLAATLRFIKRAC